MTSSSDPFALLIRRETTAEASRPVPPEVEGEQHRWSALADQFAARLSRLLGRPAHAEVAFRMTSHSALRRELPEPGILLPVGEAEDEAWMRFPAQDAMLLTSLLLGDQEGLDLPTHPSVLDGISMVAVAEPLATLIEEGFGIDLAPDTARPHTEEWPLRQPPAGERLLANFELRLGAERASFDLLFPPLQKEVLERWAARTDEGPAPAEIELDASILLCRWKSDGRSVARIAPGAEILLPGADLNRVSLEVMTGGRLERCANGTVTARRGRREMTVAELAG